MARETSNKDVVVQVPTITVGPDDLKAAFLRWETDYRLGDQKKPETRSAERTAEASAATLWNYLVGA